MWYKCTGPLKQNWIECSKIIFASFSIWSHSSRLQSEEGNPAILEKACFNLSCFWLHEVVMQYIFLTTRLDGSSTRLYSSPFAAAQLYLTLPLVNSFQIDNRYFSSFRLAAVTCCSLILIIRHHECNLVFFNGTLEYLQLAVVHLYLELNFHSTVEFKIDFRALHWLFPKWKVQSNLVYKSDKSCWQACSNITILVSYTIMESRSRQLWSQSASNFENK